MSWFKVDDKFYDHPKARKAGKAAVGVWVLAGTWSADHLTDGFIPAHVLARWGNRTDARRLVDARLWEPAEHDGEAGWRFRNWERYQPTRAAKKAQRAARAAAGRAGGLASGASRRQPNPNHSASPPVEADAKQVASRLVEPPSRPVPSPSIHHHSHLTAVPPEAPMDGSINDETLTKIQLRLRCDRPHAARVAAQVLARANTPVQDQTRYILAAIDRAPGDYQPTPGPLKRHDECVTHPGQPAANCGGCAADARTVDPRPPRPRRRRRRSSTPRSLPRSATKTSPSWASCCG